ncbi:BGTF surface domain-containing protein [Haladaptatus salinisoli]|uniref:BGTF surface domain-containing protein n=1 Tax=Haladaptatus salinisoli TaxID=2884876 RepID=UPI001D0A9763|nr:BGTF surface domain-containing protein [Haladaptatus salinisoli]
MKSDTDAPTWLVAVLLCSLAVAPLASVGVVDAKRANFEDATVGDERGDVIEVTVRANERATVNLGSPNDGFWAQVTVPKGKTTLAINTYRADDPNESVTLVEGGMKGKPEVRIPSESGPLEPGTYDMNVTVEIGGESVTQDIGSFAVKERETGDAETLVLPAGTDVSAFESPADLRKAASETENGTIAKGDKFVLALNASGLGGFIERANLGGGAENVTVTFHESNYERNTRPNEFDGDDATRFWDEENDELYLVLNTSDPEYGVEVGDEYEVTFEIGEDNPMVAESETATTRFTVVERRVELDYTGDVLVVENETTVGGTTTLAPGTTINVTAFDEGAKPFYWPKTATVTANRTFAATFDFGGVEPGTEFTLELRDQGMTVRGVVAGAPQRTTVPTTTATPTTPTTTTAVNTTTETTATATTSTPTPVPTDRPITAQTVSKGGLPGFDAFAALVALAAAALLAVRRG